MKPGKNVRRMLGRRQKDSAESPEYFLTHAVPRSKPYPYASKRQNERQASKLRAAKIERFTCPAQKQLTA